jgi:mono/diheme cytochrome c family protein
VALLNQRCAGCHNLDRVKAAKKDAATWKATVERMMGKGAQLTPAELDALVKYLAETYK